LLPNVSQNLLSPLEAYTLLRLRWQIELLFRLWKTYSQVDESKSQNPWRILTEMYAKLIAVLIQQWILLASIWPIPNKRIVLAASLIQTFAILIHLFLKDKTPYASSCLRWSISCNLLHIVETQTTTLYCSNFGQPSTFLPLIPMVTFQT
jgi:hypothetical protein